MIHTRATWYNTQNDKLKSSPLGRLDFEAAVAARPPWARQSREKNEAAAAKRREQYKKERDAWKHSR